MRNGVIDRQSRGITAERNEVSRTRTDEGIARGKAIKDELKGIDEVLRTTEEQFNLAMLTVPNVPDASVPVGKDETAM